MSDHLTADVPFPAGLVHCRRRGSIVTVLADLGNHFGQSYENKLVASFNKAEFSLKLVTGLLTTTYSHIHHYFGHYCFLFMFHWLVWHYILFQMVTFN